MIIGYIFNIAIISIIWIHPTEINKGCIINIQYGLTQMADIDISLINIDEKLTGNKILITLKDNGNGISEAVQSKIFTPNFTTKTSGTGLGLAMCKGIVEKAKGKIWFETEAGVGTTFFVELPVVG